MNKTVARPLRVLFFIGIPTRFELLQSTVALVSSGEHKKSCLAAATVSFTLTSPDGAANRRENRRRHRCDIALPASS